MRDPKARLEELEARLLAACSQAGRPRDSVTLVAVGKTKPWENIEAFARLGVRDFGENYVQEAQVKQQRAVQAGLAGIRWHLIGTLQSNKAKQVAGKFHLFHALGSLSLAEKLDKAAAAAHLVQDCLLEVNVDSEASKGGVAAGELPGLLEALSALPHLRVRGLMCIPAPGSTRAPFARLRELREELNASGTYREKLTELSMGMSADFEAAILEGATIVRVGSTLFGEREKR